MNKDSLGDRIKSLYEDPYRITLPGRLPVILRIDGCHFSSVTRGCAKPFDLKLIHAMNETAKYICKNVHNAKIAYLQSDEISILLNYNDINTQSYFNNNLQKISSVVAGMASSYFTSISDKAFGNTKVVQFDCRTFVVPKEEVNNCFLWRQQDCQRNSVQMLARSIFSHKECDKKNTSQLKQMCLDKDANWDYLANSHKLGRCIIKNLSLKEVINRKTGEKTEALRSEWVVDDNIPSFSDDVEYLNKYL